MSNTIALAPLCARVYCVLYIPLQGRVIQLLHQYHHILLFVGIPAPRQKENLATCCTLGAFFRVSSIGILAWGGGGDTL